MDGLYNKFIKNKFVVVDGILNQQLLSYLKLSSKILYTQTFIESGNDVVKGSVANGLYGNVIGDTLLKYLTPYYSKISKKELIPTYSYFRTYQKNGELLPHKDRPSCQYSATVQINRSKDEDWPFYIQNNTETFILNSPLGQITFYKGEEVLHWRDPLKYNFSSHLFLHWVDGDNPAYREFWYDGREGLGAPR